MSKLNLIESTRCKCGKLPYAHRWSEGAGTLPDTKVSKGNLGICPRWSPVDPRGNRIRLTGRPAATRNY